MISDCQKMIKKQNIFNNYQQKFKGKVCDEINFINFLEEKDTKNYEKYKKLKCCNTPRFLLIFSIIIIILTCASLYFSIRRTKGYKQYIQLLEERLISIKEEFPSEYESKKLIAYLLAKDEFEIKDEDSCSYIEFSLSLCQKEKYIKFCNEERYSKNKCNYMDYENFKSKSLSFICDITNYNNKKCNEIQYLDQQKKDKNLNEDNKIKYINSKISINITDYYFKKIWCKFENYNNPILLSFLIIMLLFILLLILDLCINKATLVIGIKYYIVLILYMIFYFIFRIYIILLLGLFIFSTIVSFASPPKIGDTSSDSQDGENIEKRTIDLMRENLIYEYIYCGINVIHFIFVIILSSYKSLIDKYLSFDFEENRSSKLLRKASIKIGKNNYDFEIVQNKNIYLKDRRENEKFYFKEIIYDNNTLYLKFNNIGIKDQLSWIEYNYPIINKGFDKLFLYFKLLIYTYIIAIVILPIFHIKDSLIYNYFLYLIDLGYKPYLYDNFQKFRDLQILVYYLIKYIFIVIGILVIFSLFKWAFYGGISNIALISVSFFISIFITLIILTFVILSFLLFVYNIIIYNIVDKITYDKKSNNAKLVLSIYLYLIQFIFISALFSINIKFSMLLNSVRKETKKLENEQLDSEEIFKAKTLNNENIIFEAINSDDIISKQLFYIKKHDDNPISNENSSTNLFFEQNQEKLLDKKKLLKLKSFKKSYKNGLSGNILSFLTIWLIYLGFVIAGLSYSIKNYEYYKEIREYLIINSKFISNNNTYFGINASIKKGLPSLSQFWCDFGNFESGITISNFIFIILHICFQIISYLIHKGIIKLDIKKGKSYYLIVLINSLFYAIFMLFIPLLLYLFIYSFIIIFSSPLEIDSNFISKTIKEQYQKLWWKKYLILYINICIKFLIFTFNVKLSWYFKPLIINYLNLNYKTEKEIEKNKKYEKKTSVIINNNIYNIKIISNDILYLKDMKLGTIYKFKQISIENITNGYVYVKLGHNSITDQISLSEWHYPELNYIFSQLATLCKLIYGILFVSILLFKCLIIKEANYSLYILSIKTIRREGKNINMPKFNGIFVHYGYFESLIVKSRFSFYLISIFFLLLFMLKRMLYGGFNSLIKSKISFIMSLIFVTLNVIYVIFDFLMVLFGIFSTICLSDIKLNDSLVTFKLYVQLIINIIIFSITIKILVKSIILSKNLNDLRKELIKFNNVEEIKEKDNLLNLDEFKYITIEGKICHLKEVRNDKLQRYLYYSLDNEDKFKANSEEFDITKSISVQNEDILKNDNIEINSKNRLNN